MPLCFTKNFQARSLNESFKVVAEQCYQLPMGRGQDHAEELQSPFFHNQALPKVSRATGLQVLGGLPHAFQPVEFLLPLIRSGIR